jgi:AraC-like DNA-binding protein
MGDSQSIAELYSKHNMGIPANLPGGLGHFNVFKLDPFVGSKATPIPYKKRDYYKITLVKGQGRVHYADRVIEVKQQALTFTNPQIPYSWENTEQISGGFFCIFSDHFFHQFGNLKQYSVYQPQGTHVFELTDEQLNEVIPVFERMLLEIESDYLHKYDVLRNQVFELLHFAMKLEPATHMSHQPITAASRITGLFMELLERQFPIDENHQTMQLRMASDYAEQLAVHVNHLNSAVKETTGKTTTQLITDRILKEAKILLKFSNWNISEIAFALGFNEVTHFSNFFKKQTGVSPIRFRKGIES